MSSLNKYELENKLVDFLGRVKHKLESDSEKGFKVL